MSDTQAHTLLGNFSEAERGFRISGVVMLRLFGEKDLIEYLCRPSKI